MSTKTWQEEFDNKYKLGLFKRDTPLGNTYCCNEELKQFITDIRKHDEEELIKLLKDFSFLDRDSEYYQHNLEQLIISHYDNK